MTGERVLERKLKRREGLRLVYDENLKSAEEYLSSENVEEAKLKAFKLMLTKSFEQLSTVDDEIVALLDPEHVPNDILPLRKINVAFALKTR